MKNPEEPVVGWFYYTEYVHHVKLPRKFTWNPKNAKKMQKGNLTNQPFLEMHVSFLEFLLNPLKVTVQFSHFLIRLIENHQAWKTFSFPVSVELPRPAPQAGNLVSR